MQDVVKTMKDDLWFRFVASLPFHVVAMVLQILLDKLFHGPAVLELGEIRYSRHGLLGYRSQDQRRLKPNRGIESETVVLGDLSHLVLY
jgi:hypothetical protein